MTSAGTKKGRVVFNSRYPAGKSVLLYTASVAVLCVSIYECNRSDGSLLRSVMGSFTFIALSIIPFLCLLLTGWRAFSSLARAKVGSSVLWVGWLTVAQATVLLLAVPLILFCCAAQFPGIPVVLAQSAKMMRGPLWSVTPDRRVLILRGEFASGMADAVEKILSADNSFRIAVLESPGGEVDEAMRIGRAIERSGLETGVATQCASACTYAFIAGRERILLPGGQLGFHACAKTVWYSDCDNQRYLSYFVANGVDETFAIKALSVDP